MSKIFSLDSSEQHILVLTDFLLMNLLYLILTIHLRTEILVVLQLLLLLAQDT